MTGAQALQAALPRLTAAGIAAPMGDARRLLAHALQVPPGRLTLVLHDPLPEAAQARFEAAIAARATRQPVSQITGTRAFFGRDFHVTPDVLDPRPETEALVLAALDRPAARLLDLGTGSGCILLTLLAEWPEATGLGIDSSAAALAVAGRNARALDVQDRAELRTGDWLTGLAGPFDLIVSNPPYITESDHATLSPEVRDWEPRGALTPGGDGLDAYRRILPGVPALLAEGGRVLLEIGVGQDDDVGRIARAAGFARIACLPDLDGRGRVMALSCG
ncbi:peptide chain release factor N(5)-glutamine methyltransferase [Fluviibacterium sp. DFM31]|uniref:Release factor glutamine methyltransferase n=1 Tax=Meridianimarinicoccus marinus TaxID=3231483 RepID=A0ABV3L1H2_9RHOB